MNYVDYPKESTNKLRKLLGEYNKAVGYKGNMQNRLYFYIIEIDD